MRRKIYDTEIEKREDDYHIVVISRRGNRCGFAARPTLEEAKAFWAEVDLVEGPAGLAPVEWAEVNDPSRPAVLFRGELFTE